MRHAKIEAKFIDVNVLPSPPIDEVIVIIFLVLSASISLIAKQITFIHPVRKEEINITAPCPKTNIWNACN